MNISTSDILDELRQSIAPIEEGATIREMAKALGIGQQAMYHRVRDLVESGRLRAVKVLRREITGRTRATDGYQLVKGRK